MTITSFQDVKRLLSQNGQFSSLDQDYIAQSIFDIYVASGKSSATIQLQQTLDAIDLANGTITINNTPGNFSAGLGNSVSNIDLNYPSQRYFIDSAGNLVREHA
jgi:hypothetical protein